MTATDCACRALLVLHVLAMVFELGIGAVTVMSLLSNMRHPDRQASPEAIKAQSDEVIATVVSLESTLVTFVFTMVGAGDAVQGLRAVGKRISALGRSISVRRQRLGSGRQRASSVGQKISEVGSVAARKQSSTGQQSHAHCGAGSEELLQFPSDAARAD